MICAQKFVQERQEHLDGIRHRCFHSLAKAEFGHPRFQGLAGSQPNTVKDSKLTAERRGDLQCTLRVGAVGVERLSCVAEAFDFRFNQGNCSRGIPAGNRVQAE